MKLEQFLNEQRPHIVAFMVDVLGLNALTSDDEILDVRLAVEPDRSGDLRWTLMTGPSDYDQRHYLLCGASSIGADTDLNSVVNELIEDILETNAMNSEELCKD